MVAFLRNWLAVMDKGVPRSEMVRVVTLLAIFCRLSRFLAMFSLVSVTNNLLLGKRPI